MNQKTTIFFIVFLFLIVLTFSCAPSVSNQKLESHSFLIKYENEKKNLPEEVFLLFYVIKNDLDYGTIDIQRDSLNYQNQKNLPKSTLQEYPSVNLELLEKIKQKFIIEHYLINGEDYELIIVARNNKNVRYKATRYSKYKFFKGKWVSLGGYLYF